MLPEVVGIVLVSHSYELARGLAHLAGQVAGGEARVIPAGGLGDALGTSSEVVEAAIAEADEGEGVVLLADIGSSILTIRGILDHQPNGHIRLADAPMVEGAVAAAVSAAAGLSLEEVVLAAEGARGVRKL
jgi:phosphoenolpyruvate---glycerone phosphotransferase subunit DhaM